MQVIIKEVKNNILYITLNRPESLNAFTTEMLMELQKAFKEAEPGDIRCVVLTGAGKGFCSGQDLKEFEAEKKTFRQALEVKYNPLIRQIMRLPKPVICGINGTAAGAGLSLALACDFRIAVEQALMIEIFINIGLVPDSASSYNLPRLTGLARAFRMCTTAERMTAYDAKQLGLVNVIVQNTEVLKTALDRYAVKFAKSPTKAIGMIKRMLNTSFEKTLDEILEEETIAQDDLGRSNDFREGVNSFLEKRKPVFTGT